MPPASPDDGMPPATFLDELSAAFRRHRPQGSLAWNFSAAFRRLEELLGPLGDRARAAEMDPVDTATPPAPGAAAALNRRTRRAGENLRALVTEPPGPKATAGHRHPEMAEMTEALESTLEALRFLSARVEALERAADVSAQPVAGPAWLLPPPATGPWAGVLLEWLATLPAGDGVLLAECGDGALAGALARAGLHLLSAEPRGAVAWARAAEGLSVRVQEALAFVTDQAPAGAVVLAGVVDRVALPDAEALLDAVHDRLVPGGGVAVLAGEPEASGWSPVARDLAPGRPRHAETWRLLLQRAGFSGVAGLAAPATPAAAAGSPVAGIVGRR